MSNCKALLSSCLALAFLSCPLACTHKSQAASDSPSPKAITDSSAAADAELGQLIESKESEYNNIYVYRKGSTVSMTFGHNRKLFSESVCNALDDRDLPLPYTRYMSAALVYPLKVESILEIGFGGGRTAWYLHRYLPGVKVTSVELDPAVVALSRKYFGISDEPNIQIVTRDGRLFLSDSKAKYDVVLLDAYRGPFVPFHLMTKEFYQMVKSHLNPGGVVAQNIEPTTMLFDSAVNTIHEVFPQVEFFDASDNNTGGSIVMIAYDRTPRSLPDLVAQAQKLQSSYSFRYDLPRMMGHHFGLKEIRTGNKVTYDVVDMNGNSTAGINEDAKVMTDDFAPVEALKAIQRHNQKWTGSAQ